MTSHRPRARLAIGLPVRNGSRFLAAALDSVLGQEFTDFEVLISDNASTDATPDIAGEYARRDPRVRHHRHPENIGAAGNFNFCFNQTNSELFKWAASDDELGPGFLDHCIAVLDAQPDVALAATRAMEIDSRGVKTSTYEATMRSDDRRPSTRFRDLIVIRHPCTLVFGVARRAALAKTRLIGRYVSADRVLLAEIALRGRIVEVDEPLFGRRVHEDNSIMLDKRDSLLAWYDPRLSGTINLPAWRVVRELLRAVRSAPLVGVEKARCYGAIAEHAGVRRDELRLDLRFGVRRLLARSLLERAPAAQRRL